MLIYAVALALSLIAAWLLPNTRYKYVFSPIFWAMLPTFLLLSHLEEVWQLKQSYTLAARSFRLWAGLPLLLCHAVALYWGKRLLLKQR